KDRLKLLQYLCISTETSDIVVQCYKQVFKENNETCAELLCVISVKINEQQLDDVFEFFMDGLCAKSIVKIALKLNERQLNKVFECLMNAFESGKARICKECAHALATISSQLGEKQFPSYLYDYNATQFLMKLKEGQLGNVFQCLINQFSYKKEDRYNRAKLLGKLSMKWNKKQLDDAFDSLEDMLNEDDYYFYTEGLGAIIVKMSGKQFDRAFNYLISELDCERRNIYIDKYAYLLDEIAQKLDKKQMNIALNYFMDKLNDKNKHQNIRIKCIKLIEEILNKCNEQQLNEIFNSSMDIFTDKNDDEDVRGECAKLLEAIAVNLNGKYFDDTFKYSNKSVQKSCANSLVTLSNKWNDKQLNIAFQCLIDGLKDSHSD
ncbi:hypothetical protein RFI_30817, partial [Reticulomyxa filosa]